MSDMFTQEYEEEFEDQDEYEDESQFFGMANGGGGGDEPPTRFDNLDFPGKINELAAFFDNDTKRILFKNLRYINMKELEDMIKEILQSVPENMVRANEIVSNRNLIMDEADNYKAETEDNANSYYDDKKYEADMYYQQRENEGDNYKNSAINSAQHQASQIIQEAQQKANDMVSEHEITVQARENANRIIYEAQNSANKIIQDATDSANKRIEDVKSWSNNILNAIYNYCRQSYTALADLSNATIDNSKVEMDKMLQNLQQVAAVLNQQNSTAQ